MKKIISIIIAAMFSLSAITSTFAAEDELSDSKYAEIQQAVYDEFYSDLSTDYNAEDVEIYYKGTASNGGIFFDEYMPGVAYLDVYLYVDLGDYYYDHNISNTVRMYLNGKIYEIRPAYLDGVIDDKILAEASDMNFGLVPKIGKSGIDSRIENDIKNDIYYMVYDTGDFPIEEFKNNTVLTYYGTASDDSIYFGFTAPDVEIPNTPVVVEIGDYIYSFAENEQVYVYINGSLYTIEDAYLSGLITDDTLGEISLFGFGLVDADNYVPTQLTTTVPVTQPTTQTETAGQVLTTASVPSTPSTADETSANNGTNDAVQTGQPLSEVYVLFLAAVVSAAILLVIKRAKS